MSAHMGAKSDKPSLMAEEGRYGSIAEGHGFGSNWRT